MKVIMLAIAGLLTLAPPASASGHTEEHYYVTAFTAMGCGTGGIAPIDMCITVLPGETTAAIRFVDLLSPFEIGAQYILRGTAAGFGSFCTSTILPIPPGTTFIELIVASPGVCPTPHEPSVGKVVASLS